MKRFLYNGILFSLVLVLTACQVAGQFLNQPAEPSNEASADRQGDFPPEVASLTEQAEPFETPAPGKENPDPGLGGKPLQSMAAEIRPKEMRTKLTHLSNLIGYKVLDANGEVLGIASDYIINTCETYIIYILMEPAASLNMAPETRVVIPFEAVTINSGVLDAQNEAIHLRLLPEQFSGAPTFPAGQQLTPTDWEKAVKAFWSKMVRIGSLATSCNVKGGPVYKVAYATQLLGAELYDGRNDLLGTVQDAILEPESGKLALYIVKPTEGDGYVLVHLRAINIPKEALLPGAALTLVLTSDPKAFWEAPHISSLGEADDVVLQNKMRQYWDR